jgi:hypothetical protein
LRQDDNSARDAAVRHFLRQADGVLLVAACSRALNDKSIHALMPLSLRTALAERGTLGDIAIVATRADDFSRAELARNLGLPEQTVASELAAERRRFLQRSISAAFFRDLPAHVLPVNKQEAAAAKAMAAEAVEAAIEDARAATVTALAPVTIADATSVEAAEAAAAAASRAPFELGVFVTSSTDYQRLIGVRDTEGDPSGHFVFAHPDQTDLPALAALLELRAHQAAADALALRAGVARAQHAGALLLESMRKAAVADDSVEAHAHGVDGAPAQVAPPPAALAHVPNAVGSLSNQRKRPLSPQPQQPPRPAPPQPRPLAPNAPFAVGGPSNPSQPLAVRHPVRQLPPVPHAARQRSHSPKTKSASVEIIDLTDE